MRKRISLVLIVTVASLLSAPVATPMKIEPIFSYQGFLTDSSGVPLNGVFDMNFRIMDSPDILWEEFHGGVQVNDGFFNVVLGEIDPIPPDAFVAESDSGEYVMRYLEVQVGADPPMSPTARLLTVPYAVGAHRVAGDIFTMPGVIRIQPPEPCLPPDPCLPTMELQAFAESTKFVMKDPTGGPDGGPISEINVNPNSSSFRMGIEPEPFEPTVEINTNPNTSSFRMGVEPVPFQPAAEIIAGQNATEFSLGVEPQPFNPAPEMEMLMDQNSTTFRMGVDSHPSNPSVQLQALADDASFTMFNPSASDDDKRVSEMNSIMGGQFSWNLWHPDAGAARQIMDMNTGPGGELNWSFFNPQPEIPGHTWINFGTNSSGPSFELTAPGQDGGAGLDITNPMLQLSADSAGPAVTLKRIFDSAGTTDSTRIRLVADSGNSVFEMSGPTWGDETAIKMRTVGDFPAAYIQLYSPPPYSSIYPNVTISSEEGGGGINVRDQIEYMAFMSSRYFNFYNYNTGETPLRLSADEGSYFMNNVGIGTSATGNILTVAPFSPTDPIADAWTVYSSRRWKKNIKPIENALEKVESLQGVSFDWKADGKHDIGLIAEEVGEIVPEVVVYEENGVDAKSVDYARLVSVLIEAVKEQQAEIDDLKQRIEEIELKNQLSMGAINK